MITVSCCATADEAHVVQALLADCGIVAYLPEDMAVTYFGSAGGFQVQVAEEQAETARTILAGASGRS